MWFDEEGSRTTVTEATPGDILVPYLNGQSHEIHVQHGQRLHPGLERPAEAGAGRSRNGFRRRPTRPSSFEITQDKPGRGRTFTSRGRFSSLPTRNLRLSISISAAKQSWKAIMFCWTTHDCESYATNWTSCRSRNCSCIVVSIGLTVLPNLAVWFWRP